MQHQRSITQQERVIVRDEINLRLRLQSKDSEYATSKGTTRYTMEHNTIQVHQSPVATKKLKYSKSSSSRSVAIPPNTMPNLMPSFSHEGEPSQYYNEEREREREQQQQQQQPRHRHHHHHRHHHDQQQYNERQQYHEQQQYNEQHNEQQQIFHANSGEDYYHSRGNLPPPRRVQSLQPHGSEEQQFHEQHNEQQQIFHANSGEDYYHSRGNLPLPRRVQSLQPHGSEEYHARVSPRRTVSDSVHNHRHQSYNPPHLPRQSFPDDPPSSAFEAYPHPRDYEPQRLPRGGRGGGPHAHAPPQIHLHRENHYHGRPLSPPLSPTPAPLSYVCDSARSCYPSTALGVRIRDELRSMTEGTRLVPQARAVHNAELETEARGMVLEAARGGMIPDHHHSNPNHHHGRGHGHHRQHPHPHPHSRTRNIRLLDSTKDILETHSILGQGTFSFVIGVTIKESKRRKKEQDQQDQQHRPRGRRRPQRQRYYACKSIKEELLVSNVARMGKRRQNRVFDSETHLQSTEYCVLAASQLAYEAHVLSCLDHPNIVKLRGLDADGILGFEKRDHRGFFMLMDILSDTLDKKIDRWRSETALSKLAAKSKAKAHANLNILIPHNDQTVLLRRNMEKVGISIQLASALEYIHDRRIVYRDLKPSNIGFVTDGPPGDHHYPPGSNSNSNSISQLLHARTPTSQRERVQLFDFGLSRELTPGTPTLTGAIGTMRYMSPEVCLESNYDCDCDIYSYAIVCWELWTQKVPFEDVTTPDLYRQSVCQRGHRPVYRPDTEEDNDGPHVHMAPQQQQHQRQRHPPVQAVPTEILILLSQAWKHDPRARIRWPKTRNQLILLETLVGLQLEERDLSDSTAAAAATAIANAAAAADDARHRVHGDGTSFDHRAPNRNHSRNRDQNHAPNRHAHRDRDRDVISIDDDSNHSMFSLNMHDVDFNEDLGMGSLH